MDSRAELVHEVASGAAKVRPDRASQRNARRRATSNPVRRRDGTIDGLTERMTGSAVAGATSKFETSSSALRFRDVRIYCFARFSSLIAQTMQNIAIGWFVYGLTHSAWSLGLTGLFTFLPVLVFALVTGQVADTFDRRLVVAASNGLTACVAAALLVYSLTGAQQVWPVYILATLIGASRSFGNPAGRALLPNLVPREHFANAVAWSSSFDSFASTVGPAIGGVLYMIGAQVVFAFAMTLYAAASVGMLAIKARPAQAKREPATWKTVTAGLKFIYLEKIILAAISLDMAAVCLGGVGALLPIFSDALHAGSWGSGFLRSSQALGALCMAYMLAHLPVRRRAGVKLLWSVAAYGSAIIAFGLSRNILTSVMALFAVGAADQISVFIRQTIVQADTPDAMRGRVSAVNVIFVGASGSLGEFESGVLASLVGAAPAVLIGGAGAMACAALWGLLFPALRARDCLVAPDIVNVEL